jgi:hypothetical protein
MNKTNHKAFAIKHYYIFAIFERIYERIVEQGLKSGDKAWMGKY